MPPIYTREKLIERFLRKHKFFLYSATILTSLSLYGLIGLCLYGFKNGNYWTILPAGLLAHSFFVITMHDGAHRSITKTNFDYFIMNFCSGLIILPVYTELFKKFHLIHHANTNTDDDPLWSDQKNRIFNERRVLYTILQAFPFIFNLAILLGYKKTKRSYKGNVHKVNLWYVMLSVLISSVVIYLFGVSFLFWISTITVMTALGAVRYWGEHMGVENNKESNTHWFPLGMGIGNHEVHHGYPGYSWLTLTIGLLYRKMDTNPIKSIYGIYFDKRYHHYKEVSRK